MGWFGIFYLRLVIWSAIWLPFGCRHRRPLRRFSSSKVPGKLKESSDEKPNDVQVRECSFAAHSAGHRDGQEEEPDHHSGRWRRWALTSSDALRAGQSQFAAIDSVSDSDLPADATADAAADDASDPVSSIRPDALLSSDHPAHLSSPPEQLSTGASDSATVSMTVERFL